MKPVDIVILGIIGVVLVLVLLRIKKKGSCGCGCQNCRSACQKGKGQIIISSATEKNRIHTNKSVKCK